MSNRQFFDALPTKESKGSKTKNKTKKEIKKTVKVK